MRAKYQCKYIILPIRFIHIEQELELEVNNVCGENSICRTNYYCDQEANKVSCSPICYHEKETDPVCCTTTDGGTECSEENEMCYIRDPAENVGDYVCTYVVYWIYII